MIKNTYKKLPALLLLAVIALCICGADISYSYGAAPAGEKVTVNYYKNFDGSTDTFSFGAFNSGDLFTAINTRSARFYVDAYGYEFKSWNTKPDGSGDDYYPGVRYPITGELNLYAQWVRDVDYWYMITYHPNGGSGSYIHDNLEPGIYTVKNLTAAGISRSGYDFLGWCTDPDGNGEFYYPNNDIEITDRSITLYAIWIFNPDERYQVVYYANGGMPMTPFVDTVVPGSSYQIKDLDGTGIYRPLFKLLYWTENADGTGERYYPGDYITIDGYYVLYAQWQLDL